MDISNIDINKKVIISVVVVIGIIASLVGAVGVQTVLVSDDSDTSEGVGTNSEVEFDYNEDDNTVEVTVLELDTDEYIFINTLSEDNIEVINEDNDTGWADADEEGQVITVRNVSSEDTFSAEAIKSEDDVGQSISIFTHDDGDDENEEDIETDDERVIFTHNDESIDVNVSSLNDGEKIYMHVHNADNYKINNEDMEINGAIVADEEGQTVNIQNTSEDTVITVIVRDDDNNYIDSLEYSVSNEEISDFEWEGYDDLASVLMEESDNGVKTTIIRHEGSYFTTKVHSDNDYEIIGAEDTPDWADASDVGQEINVENLSVGDEVIIYSSREEDGRSYRVQSYEITE